MTSRDPVLVRVANCKGVSTTAAKSRAIYERALTEPGHYGVPHIVLAMETLKVDAKAVAAAHDRKAIQFGFPHDPARAGSAIAYDPEHVRIKNPDIVLTSHSGDGTRDRYTVRAFGDAGGHGWLLYNAGHTPPDRSEKPQAEWYRNARALAGVLGADFNDRPDFLDTRYNRQVCALRGEVLGLLVPRHIRTSDTKPINIGSDHLGQDTLLWPKVA